MPKRNHNPAKASLKSGQSKGPLTEAIEECEQLYATLKWAAHTQQMPGLKNQHLDVAQAHLDRIQELIDNAR